jgi:hypothetical protein
MDPAVFATLERIAAETDKSKKQRMKDDSEVALAEHFGNAAHLSDLTELSFDLVNLAWADAMAVDLVPQIIEVKTVGMNDTDYIEDDLRGLRAYWQGKGGQILSDVLRYERTFMPREEIVTAIDGHQDEFASNFWGSFDRLRSQANEKVRQAPVFRLVELVRAAITGGSYYGTFAAATLTSDQIDSVVDEVIARSGRASILGSPMALRYLASIGLEYGDEAKNQILKTGRLGVYKGSNVVELENFEDFAGNFVLPNNELWIVGKKAGRLTYYGDAAKVQILQLPSFMRRWETAKDAGMLLFGAERGYLARIVLT